MLSRFFSYQMTVRLSTFPLLSLLCTFRACQRFLVFVSQQVSIHISINFSWTGWDCGAAEARQRGSDLPVHRHFLQHLWRKTPVNDSTRPQWRDSLYWLDSEGDWFGRFHFQEMMVRSVLSAASQITMRLTRVAPDPGIEPMFPWRS